MAAVILDLIAKLDVAPSHRCARVGDHRTSMTCVVLLEGQASRRQPGARARWTRRMLMYESLQMLVRRSTIAARLLQLGERQERIVGVGRQRILDDHAAIVPLRIRGSLSQRAAPEQGVTV